MSDDVRYLVKRGTTNWQLYSLEAIWDMLESEDGHVSWEQGKAWLRCAQLCEDQANLLTDALVKLQRHWPAQRGSASDLFGVVVKEIVNAMRQTAADARSNKSAIESITVDLGTARAQVASLLDQRDAYLRKESELAQPRPIPHPGDVPPDWPPNHWRETLANEARRIMATLDDNAKAQAITMQANVVGYGSDDPVEVIAPTDRPGRGVGYPGGQETPYIPLPAYDPPATSIAVHSVVPNEAPDQPSPDPSGRPGAQETPTDPAVPTSNGPVLAGMNGAENGPVPGLFSPSTSVQPAASDIRVPPSSLGNGDAPRATAIVATPGAASAARPWSAATGTSGARLERSGTYPMMAPPMAPTSTGGQRTAGVAPGGHVPGYRDRNRRRDPNDPWLPKEGNPVVIEAPPDSGEHDPGPGVIGIDR